MAPDSSPSLRRYPPAVVIAHAEAATYASLIALRCVEVLADYGMPAAARNRARVLKAAAKRLTTAELVRRLATAVERADRPVGA